jgi:hypothetical protein
MSNINYENGTPRRTILDNTDFERIIEINKAMIKESYSTTKNIIDKAVSLQSSINDKDNEIMNAKRKIIDNVLKLDNSNDESTTNDAEQQLKTILSKYPTLSGYVSHIRQELR